LVLVLYNTFGYYLFFVLKCEEERLAFSQQMPTSESAFEVVKYNLAIYSSVPDSDYEYENRDITIDNKTYRIVRRFVKNDTLNIVYLRNYAQDELREQFHEILESQLSDAVPVDSGSPLKQFLKSISDDYLFNDIPLWEQGGVALATESCPLNAPPVAVLRAVYLSNPSPPPDLG
jgi:hypothetical protein